MSSSTLREIFLNGMHLIQKINLDCVKRGNFTVQRFCTFYFEHLCDKLAKDMTDMTTNPPIFHLRQKIINLVILTY